MESGVGSLSSTLGVCAAAARSLASSSRAGVESLAVITNSGRHAGCALSTKVAHTILELARPCRVLSTTVVAVSRLATGRGCWWRRIGEIHGQECSGWATEQTGVLYCYLVKDSKFVGLFEGKLRHS